MTGGLSAFLALNAVKPENIRFAASRRFVDEDGKPVAVSHVTLPDGTGQDANMAMVTEISGVE